MQVPGSLVELLDPPDLDDAACLGLAPLFDLDVAGEGVDGREDRHDAAVRVCRTCPVLDECRSMLAAAPEAAGVWAGRVVVPVRGGPGWRSRQQLAAGGPALGPIHG